jgi:hypothetical protein
MQSAAADPIEKALSQFFDQEMPKPWPLLQLPRAGSNAKLAGRAALRRSHMALAASLAMLVAGLGLASGMIRSTTPNAASLPARASHPSIPIRHTPPATTPHIDAKPPINSPAVSPR